MERETAEQKKEQADYAALSSYKLDPNQELTESQYTSGIAAFNKFRTDYPQTHFADDIKKRIVTWSEELANLQSGKVKFANQWMTPDEKKPQAEQWQKKNAVQSTQHSIQSLKNQLASLQNQRKVAADNQTIEGQLATRRLRLRNLEYLSARLSDERRRRLLRSKCQRYKILDSQCNYSNSNAR